MEPACPTCHLKLNRGEDDYFLGSLTINFVVAELLVVLGAGLGIYLTWPEVPWGLLTWSLALLVVLAPVVFYPFAQLIWLAMDLIFRPLTLKDLEGHGENLSPGPVLPPGSKGPEPDGPHPDSPEHA